MQHDGPVKAYLSGLDVQDRAGGVGYRTTDVVNWWNRAGSTGTLVQRVGAHGGWADEAYFQSKQYVLVGSIQAKNRPEALAMLEALDAAIPLNAFAPLVVEEDGLVRHALVRQSEQPLYEWLTDTYITFNIQLQAPDNRRFTGDGSGPAHTVEAFLPFQQGGIAPPYTPPFVIDATVISGSVDVVNAGSAAPAVVARIHGPVTDPVVTTDDGQSMRFDLDLWESEFLEVDFDSRTIRLNGQASRRGQLRGRWITFSAGTTRLRFDAAAYNPTARMQVSWTDAFK